MADGELEELESRVRAGDTQALGMYLQNHRDKLMRALERKVGAGLRRKLDLEDIFQEVVTRAIRDVGSVDFSGQDPMGWIYQVMDRQIVDLHRFHFEVQKRDAKREVSVDQPRKTGSDSEGGFADLLIASMTTPSAAVSRDLKMMRIYQALEGLNEDMRKAVRWRYLENLPSREIAERLGKSDAATRVLLSRAIRKLQAALGQDS